MLQNFVSAEYDPEKGILRNYHIKTPFPRNFVLIEVNHLGPIDPRGGGPELGGITGTNKINREGSGLVRSPREVIEGVARKHKLKYLVPDRRRKDSGGKLRKGSGEHVRGANAAIGFERTRRALVQVWGVHMGVGRQYTSGREVGRRS
jgi:hypothetical protein